MIGMESGRKREARQWSGWQGAAVVAWLAALALMVNAGFAYVSWLSEAVNPLQAVEKRLAVEAIAADAAEARYRAENPEPPRAPEGAIATTAGRTEANLEERLRASWERWKLDEPHRRWEEGLTAARYAVQPTRRALGALGGSPKALADLLYGPSAYRVQTTRFALSALASGVCALCGLVLWRRAP